MLCSGSLCAAVLLACWGFILYGVYARFGQEKSRSRSPEKFMQVSMMQSHFFVSQLQQCDFIFITL